MSNPDSFIDEVSEELRRDRLFAAFRRYGWIGGLAVVLIVGGATWNELRKSQTEARAQAFGDGLIDALDLGEPAARAAALAEVTATGSQLALKVLIETADSAADRPAALAALAGLAADTAQPQLYRDLASLRRVMLAGADLPLAERRAALEAIAPRAFGVLAREQLAYLLIEEGQTEAAIAALSALIAEQNAPAGLIARASQAIVALGGELPQNSAG